MLHAQTKCLDRIVAEMKALSRAQDSAEIKIRELALLPTGTRNLGDRRGAFETTGDLAGEAYQAETGETWRPRRGLHTPRQTSSPPPPSMRVTSSRRGWTTRPGRTCLKAPSSWSRAVSRPRTQCHPAHPRPRLHRCRHCRGDRRATRPARLSASPRTQSPFGLLTALFAGVESRSHVARSTNFPRRSALGSHT